MVLMWDHRLMMRRADRVACEYDTVTGAHTFTTLRTTPAAVHDRIAESSPGRVAIEVGTAAGWVKDLCEALGVAVEVANPNHEAWRWKRGGGGDDRRPEVI